MTLLFSKQMLPFRPNGIKQQIALLLCVYVSCHYSSIFKYYMRKKVFGRCLIQRHRVPNPFTGSSIVDALNENIKHDTSFEH